MNTLLFFRTLWARRLWRLLTTSVRISLASGRSATIFRSLKYHFNNIGNGCSDRSVLRAMAPGQCKVLISGSKFDRRWIYGDRKNFLAKSSDAVWHLNVLKTNLTTWYSPSGAMGSGDRQAVHPSWPLRIRQSQSSEKAPDCLAGRVRQLAAQLVSPLAAVLSNRASRN